MAEKQLTLTSEECAFLADLLENAKKETLVEEHRTRTLDYREHIVKREALIVSVLSKLQTSR